MGQNLVRTCQDLLGRNQTRSYEENFADQKLQDVEAMRSELNYAKISIFKQLITVWIFQIIFCILILYDVKKEEDGVFNVTRIADFDVSFL